MTCQEAREYAAAALLTGQKWESDVDAHISTCFDCQREIEQLRSTVSLLVLAPPAATTEGPGDLLLHRTLARATRERRRRRIVASIAVAASLLLVPALVWGISNVDSTVTATTASPTILRTTASDPATGVKGSAQLQPSVSGSELVVEVSGVKSGTKCTLVMVDRVGQRTRIDSWTADYAGEATVATQISVPASQVSHVELIDASADEPLLHFSFA
ncbi:MAG: hypothetical protein ACJ72Y_01270 [Actinomycetes bacterium]